QIACQWGTDKQGQQQQAVSGTQSPACEDAPELSQQQQIQGQVQAAASIGAGYKRGHGMQQVQCKGRDGPHLGLEVEAVVVAPGQLGPQPQVQGIVIATDGGKQRVTCCCAEQDHQQCIPRKRDL